MIFLEKVKKVMKNPAKLIIILNRWGLANWLSDRIFLKIYFKARMNKKLNLDKPKTFNEKIQWLKIFDRKPEYIQMVDKYEVRKYITDTIGEKYLIPLLGIWDTFEEIDFTKLPEQFVLKCTHDSGGVVICKNKNELNLKEIEKKFKKTLNRNYYYEGREWPYKNITPRIICEKYMVDESKVELKDYKYFCFDGVPKAMFIASDRGNDTKFDFYDLDFNPLPIMQHYKNSTKIHQKPEGFAEMIELSKKLSKNIPHVRIDFYNIKGKIYFGEITFYHFSGFEIFEPEKYDEIFGNWIELPR